MNENLINRLLSVPVGGVNSRLCYEAATEIQQLNIEVQRLSKLLPEKPVNANVDLQKEALAQAKEFSEKLDAQHKDYLARRDDEELGFFAAHTMVALMSRVNFESKYLAARAFEYAQEMIDYKKNMKESPQYQPPAVLGGGVLGGAQQQQGDFNYMRASWDCSFCNTQNDKSFSRCYNCGQSR